MDVISLSFSLSDAEYRYAYRSRLRAQRKLLAFLTTSIAAVFLLGVINLGLGQLLWGYLCIALAIVLALGNLRGPVRAMTARTTRDRENAAREHLVTASASGVEFQVLPSGQILQIPWDQVIDPHVEGGLWVLRDDRGAVLVPRRAFASPHDEERFASFAGVLPPPPTP